MDILEWARTIKPDLIELQRSTGIPALWAAAQMAHESCDPDSGGLSGLARNAHNYAGLKWADWEKDYGCKPVTYGTWEVVNNKRVDLQDSFCFCPDWETWLKVYSGLLTGNYYGGALAFKEDPLLYGLHVWKAGWATDPAYITGVGAWMARLMPDYADTLAVAGPAVQTAAASLPESESRQTVAIRTGSGEALCNGWLQDDKTVVHLRALAEALHFDVSWDGDTYTVTLTQKP